MYGMLHFFSPSFEPSPGKVIKALKKKKKSVNSLHKLVVDFLMLGFVFASSTLSFCKYGMVVDDKIYSLHQCSF